MTEDINTIIIPIKNYCYDEKHHELHNLLSKLQFKRNKLMDIINKILLRIDAETDKDCFKGDLIENLKVELNITRIQINFIINFLYDNDLIEDKNGGLSLTSYGKLFLISDDVSVAVDVCRYLFDRCDWNRVIDNKINNKYLEINSREYVASLFLKCKDISTIEENVKNSAINLESLHNSHKNLLEFLNDSGIKKIVEEFLIPLGLIKNEETNKNYALTNVGEEFFKFYSRNIKEQYIKMIEESWENFDRGNFQEAYDMANSILYVENNIPEPFNIIGCVCIKKKEYELAKSIFLYAINICEENILELAKDRSFINDVYIPLYYNLGLCNFLTGEFFNAIKIFSNIRKTLPYKLDNVEKLHKKIKEIIVLKQ